MSLFDPTTFDAKPRRSPARSAPKGPYLIEVWVTVGAGWVSMANIERGGSHQGPDRYTRKWTFDALERAVTAACDWIDAGDVINPLARVIDVSDGSTPWVSKTKPGAAVPVSPEFL